MKKNLVLTLLTFMLTFKFSNHPSFSNELDNIANKQAVERTLEEIILPDTCKLLLLSVDLKDNIGREIIETACPYLQIKQLFKLIPNQT